MAQALSRTPSAGVTAGVRQLAVLREGSTVVLLRSLLSLFCAGLRYPSHPAPPQQQAKTRFFSTINADPLTEQVLGLVCPTASICPIYQAQRHTVPIGASPVQPAATVR